jgi:nucleoside 2-deoxyribosyltransferase
MVVFLAAPIASMLRGPQGLEAGFRDALMSVEAALVASGHEVISAHRREDWGRRLDTPANALRLDLAGIDRCDVIVAFVGDPPSPGVQLELGYAIARDKRIVALVSKDSADRPYLLDGIPTVASASIVTIANMADAAEVLDREL